MITLMKRSTSEQYQFLYDKASNLLKTHDLEGNEVAIGDANAIMSQFIDVPDPDSEGSFITVENRITSLEEYFSYIEELVKFDKRYTMLPLDEDVFEIDLNTRTITVPQVFQKNGISVQGDEVAEVVYFKCNRYYDSTDLGNIAKEGEEPKMQIFIEWESSAKDEQGNTIKGVSVPWVIDLEKYPDYIVFGWPLSTKITQAPGSVKFAVRFFKWDANSQSIVYSLSTLTQTATIKPALNYDLNQIIPDGSLIDDVRGLILNRFDNTTPTNISTVAEDPEILGYLRSEDLINFAPILPMENFELQNLAMENGFRNGAIKLGVKAISVDAGALSYKWIRRPIGSATADPEYAGGVTEMIRTPDERRVEGKLYYEKVTNGGSVAYQIYTGENLISDNPEQPLEIYEKISSAIVDKVGTYEVSISNRVGQAIKKVTSLVCLVPEPKAPVISSQVDNSAILEEVEDEEHPLQAVLTIAANTDDEGVLTYQWKRIPPEGELQEIDGATGNSFVAYDDGTYFCVVTNNLNREVNVVGNEATGMCRVTHAATAPKVDRAETTGMNVLYDVASTNGISIEANIPASANEYRTEEDALIYQWYMYDNSQGTHDVDRDHAEANVTMDRYTVKNSDMPVHYGWAEDELQGPTLVLPVNRPDLGGKTFFCVVTNRYNGNTASTCSPFIDIIS